MTFLVGYVFPILSIGCGVIVLVSLVPFVREVNAEASRKDRDDH